MTARTVPPDRYLRQLRVLGAWWSLGSSAVEQQLLVELSSLDDIDPARIKRPWNWHIAHEDIHPG